MAMTGGQRSKSKVFIALRFIVLRQCLSLNLKHANQDVLAGHLGLGILWLTPSQLWRTGVPHFVLLLPGLWRAELKFSSLFGKHFTNWAIHFSYQLSSSNSIFIHFMYCCLYTSQRHKGIWKWCILLSILLYCKSTLM